MKKIFYILITLILTLGISTSVLAARYGLDEAATGAKYNTASATGGNIYYYLQNIVSALLGLVAIIFFILATYAGIRWMNAMGNEEMKTRAKDTLINSVIGLVIVVASYGLTSFLFKYLLGGGVMRGGAYVCCQTGGEFEVQIVPRGTCNGREFEMDDDFSCSADGLGTSDNEGQVLDPVIETGSAPA